MRIGLLSVASGVVLLLSAATIAHADDVASISIKSIGFQGRYKLGCWFPISVSLANGEQPLAGRIESLMPDGDGVPTRIVGPQIELAAGQSTSAIVYGRMGRPDGPLEIALRDSPIGQSPDSLPTAMAATQELIVELGASIGFEQFSRYSEQIESERTVAALVEDLAQLPDRWYGYEGVDVVTLATSDADRLARFSPAAIDALDCWVQLGGRLIFCVGANAERVLAADVPLARFAPGKFERMTALRSLRAWETLAGTSVRLGDTATTRVETPRLIDVRGRIEAYDGIHPADLPLVVRSAHGFGEVVFVAADLDRAPFVSWTARTQLLSRLLSQAGVAASSADSAGQAGRLGYSDLVGQLRIALDQFEGVQLTPFGLIAVMAAAYIALLFPVEYFLLRKLGRRMELTWLLFPAIVLIFCGGAYAMARRWKGDAVRVNQVDVIDCDVSSGLTRGTTWLNLFSPDSESYNLQLLPPLALGEGRGEGKSFNGFPSLQPSPGGRGSNDPPRATFAWLGLPGSGLGGMNSTATGLTWSTPPYAINPDNGTISELPMLTWSSRAFTGRWQFQDTPAITGTLQNDSERLLTGEIHNGLDFALTDCVLFVGTWAYTLDTLKPGERQPLGRSISPQTIDTFLTKRRIIGEHDQATKYDRASTDVARIMQMMMFYKAAGGHRYTGLLNRSAAFLDLSDQLTLGRAILVGRGPSPTGLMRDGQPLTTDATALYRFVFPVTTTK